VVFQCRVDSQLVGAGDNLRGISMGYSDELSDIDESIDVIRCAGDESNGCLAAMGWFQYVIFSRRVE